MVSLKGLLSQLASLPSLWRSSRSDAFVWTGTLLTVVLIDIAAGLAIGVLLSLGVLLWRHQRPPAELLGRLPGTQHYVALERYQAVRTKNVERYDDEQGSFLLVCHSIIRSSHQMLCADALYSLCADAVEFEGTRYASML